MSWALAVALGTALLFTSGCRGSSTNGGGGSTPAASPSSTLFNGQNLPSKVERLSGTPLYRKDLAGKVKLEGAPFLLIAPQDPTRALLVVETGTTAAELAARPSQQADFSGITETLDAPELAKFVKDNIGLELKTHESGEILVLRVARPAGAPKAPPTSTPEPSTPVQDGSASATPQTSTSPAATPSMSSTPAGDAP